MITARHYPRHTLSECCRRVFLTETHGLCPSRERLELSVLRRKDQTLKAQAETSVRTRTKLTCIEIPLIVVLIHAASLDLVEQLLIVLFTNRSADDLTNTWEEHIGALHGLTVGVFLHVERLDLGRIVGHDHRTLEVLLYKIALMLTAEVHAPTGDREFELMSVLDSLLQDADALGIRQAYEILLDDRLQRSDQRLVDHLARPTSRST